jgi:DNA-binding NtrC family response regulator
MAKETIIILDNEHYTLWTLKTLLESEKYIVLDVDTIERALRSFQEFEVSALITEYRIGHTNVPDIVRELKKSFPELYVMMLTDENLGQGEYKKTMRAGIDDFFLKPFSSEKILLHLKKGLKQRKIFLQKKRLEEKLNQMKANGNFQDMSLSRESSSNDKSLICSRT